MKRIRSAISGRFVRPSWLTRLLKWIFVEERVK
jgi:hypothetical protein